MEGKRVAAATLYCICMLIMLSGQQQQVTAGLAGFCGCFGDCYHGCREGHGHPRWFCTVKCVDACTLVVSDEVHDATFGATADCSKICSFSTSICGVAQITDGTTDAACVDDCTERIGTHRRTSTLDNWRWFVKCQSTSLPVQKCQRLI